VISHSPRLFTAVFCDRPPIVDNGYVSLSDGLLFGDVAMYECFDGLVLNGNPNVTCQSDKTWSTPPTCSGKPDDW